MSDLISRQAVLDAIDTYDKFGYTETGCFVREPKGDYVPYIHYDDVIKCIKNASPVTPQQRTGRWVKTRLDEEPDKICDDCGTYCWKCSICGSDASGWGNYKYCPKCGAKMEVEE